MQLTESNVLMIDIQIGFYKTFSRPIAKVLLMAMFTYQLAYWGWTKLEKDEVKAQKTGEQMTIQRKGKPEC